MQGTAFIPNPGNLPARSNDRERQIADAIESGAIGNPSCFAARASKIAPPSLGAVLSALVSDSSVLDYASFDVWAAEYGYDSDSRSAEAAFRACLDVTIKLRGAIGQRALEELQTVGRFN